MFIKATPNPDTASVNLEVTKVADDVLKVMRSDANGTYPVRAMEGQLPSAAVTSESRRNLALNPSFEAAGATTTLATNHAINSSFEATSGTVEVARNLSINPSFETSLDGLISSAHVTVEMGSFPDATADGINHVKVAVTQETDFAYIGERVNATPGEFLGFGINVRPSTGSRWMWQRLAFKDINDATISDVFNDTVYLQYNDGGDRYVLAGEVPAGTVTAIGYVYIYETSTMGTPAAADTVYFADSFQFCEAKTQAHAEALVSEFFDGSTPAAGDYTYAWTGTAGLSESVRQGVGLPAWSTPDAYCIQSSERMMYGDNSLLVLGKGVSSFVNPYGGSYTALLPNTTYRVSVWSFSPVTNSYDPNIRVGGSVLDVGNTTPIATKGQWVKHEREFTTSSTVTSIPIYVYCGGAATDKTWWDGFLLTEVEYQGGYFDGDSEGDYTYSWNGTPHQSRSLKQVVAANKWKLADGGYATQINVTDSSYMRLASDTEAELEFSNVDPFNITDLKTVTVSGYVRSSAYVDSMMLRVALSDTSATKPTATRDFETKSLDAGAWKRIHATLDVRGYNRIHVGFVAPIVQTADGLSTVDVDKVLVERGELAEYFDGDTVNADMGTYSWTGTAHLSESILSNGGTLALVDYEAAAGTVIYSVNDGAASIAVENTIDSPWLMMPIMAQFSTPIRGIYSYDSSRAMSSTIHPIIGRSNPLVTIGKLQSRQGQFDIWCEDYAEAREIEAVFARGEIVMMRQNEAGLDMYFTASSVSTNPYNVNGEKTRWKVTVQFIETLRPEGFLVGALGWNFDSLATGYATYNDVLATFATYDDLTLGEVS